MLEKIDSPADVKKLNLAELNRHGGGADPDDLRRRRVDVVPTLAGGVDSLTHEPVAPQLEPGNAALAEPSTS